MTEHGNLEVGDLDREKKQLFRDKLLQLSECNEIVSAETLNAVGHVVGDVRAAVDNAPSSDELDEDLEEEYQELNCILDLPDDTYSLTAIRPELPVCVRYGVRAGLSHINMSKFSPLSRGHQSGATAIAAFATTTIYKSRCWNEAVIDQIIEDGDTFYCESYKNINTDDRRLLSILDLKREVFIQNKLNVNITIKDPAYAGKFRSNNPTELHLVKALSLFFKRYKAAILTSPVLNMAIWKDTKYYNLFDGQARRESCEPAEDGVSGTAKLFLVKDLMGVLFIILEKSNVKNEPFVLYSITISKVDEPFSMGDDPDEPIKSIGVPQRRPSGYKVKEKYRAVVQGSYHLMHPAIPEMVRGKGHLIIALAALVYSRLVNANKWTTALVDLIFNQSNIYLVDLVRVIDKKFEDAEFELKLDDIMGDLILGVYSAKVKILLNVVPGLTQTKRVLTLETGMREFFDTHDTGILEIKKFYYAIWKHHDTYYFLDPFACDENGYRVNFADAKRYSKDSLEAACATMNSSINQMTETILENTQNKDKDPFVIHGLRILYVKTGTTSGGPLNKVIHREKGTNRRAQALVTLPPVDEVDQVIDMTPKIRPSMDKIKDSSTQFPDLMENVESFMMQDDEPQTYVVVPPDDEKEETKQTIDQDIDEDETDTETQTEGTLEEDVSIHESIATETLTEETFVKSVKGYKVVNPHRLVLQGSKNCLDEKFKVSSRGKQGLISALTALAYRKLKKPELWRNLDVNQIIDVSNKTYDNVIGWIKQGSPELGGEADEALGEAEEEEEEEEEEGVEETDEPGGIKPAPSHLDISMLPAKLRLGEDDAFFKTKMNIVNGEANPLANLAEALECYFNRYFELVLENKKLMYGIWREDSKFFMFNPYGSDEEGWRLRDHPASFAVTENLNELIDLLYGVLEFNDPSFALHFVALDSIHPGKFAVTEEIVIPDDATIEKFKTRFLPITDNDLLLLKEQGAEEAEPETVDAVAENVEEEEELGEEEEEAGEEDDEEDEDRARLRALEQEQDKPVVDPLLEVQEQDQPDAPFRLNLILLTSNMKIYDDEEVDYNRLHHQVIMERLKYNHPPPYVLPSNKILATLLNAKRAKKSVHSLVSRFSIDWRLDVKKKDGLSATFLTRSAVLMPIVPSDDTKSSKMIKLSPKRYLYSRVLPICLMPLRAIDDVYIQHNGADKSLEEEAQRELEEKNDNLILEDLPEIPTGVRIRPQLIPLGPIIRTPVVEKKIPTCIEKKKRKFLLAKGDEGDPIMEKVLCNTEDLLLELFFPDFKVKDQSLPEKKDTDSMKEKTATESTLVPVDNSNNKKPSQAAQETVGFTATADRFRLVRGNLCLQNRKEPEVCHFKSCFFSALLCILAKIKLRPDNFRGSTLDQCIFLGDKIYRQIGKLRFKPYRWFHHIEILHTIYNVITKQATYADPENCPDDELEPIMEAFLEKNQTGIIVFVNSSYAFWTANGKYYLFDSYACNDQGDAVEDGNSCLMEFCDFYSMLEKIEQNVGEDAKKPYRLYTVSITHMESRKRKKKRRRKQAHCAEKPEEPRVEEPPELEVSTETESSLIELSDWLQTESKVSINHDMTIPGFAPMKYHDASMLDVVVLENEITSPVLAPFKKTRERQENNINLYETPSTMIRRKIYDRTFKAHCAVATPLDLCIIAWSLIHDPITWSVRTVKGLFEASLDYTFDSILATEDSTIGDMTDGLLHEFEIANYIFQSVFVPIHYGKLYTIEGWNLATSLQRMFDTPSYTGAIIICGDAHIGITSKDENYFAWWTMKRTKILRIVTTTDLKEFLRLIIKEIDQPEEVPFVMRVITISYAQKVDPDCSDVKGLHEPVIPITSLPEIHRKENKPYDLEAIFRPTTPNSKPIFVLGTVALSGRDLLKEPRVKRCYFVAILAVMVKRDIIQSPIPGMIDKVVEVAELLYREFEEPKFHTEHILRNVTLMNRIFDLRDCALPLVTLTVNPRTLRNDFNVQVKKHLKRFFKTNASGIIHFTNCCYGFWYSRSTNAYYYLDPYQCNDKGRKVTKDGKTCLCIFPSVCQMVKNMCCNQFCDTTGFFIHRLHVESINVPPFKTFKEDPMWLYLDYHWNFRHAPPIVKSNTRKKKVESNAGKGVRQFWNNYAIEVLNLIYSIWGTIGSYDSRFGDRAGKNQAAICVAVLAMQYLNHPSRWGPAILDSAVICGDTYYTESLRSSVQKCAKHFNRFNLQTCFKIFPHLWTIDFKDGICGNLYGARNRMTLAVALAAAFKEAPNVLIECNKITLAALAAKDGYYVSDPGWIGPPLFNKDHGAIYVLRCRNMNSLVYGITKMLNTNQRLEFSLTPVLFTFQQEDMDIVNSKTLLAKKKILLEPARTTPGKVEIDVPVIPGAFTAPDEDSYMIYRKHIALGTQKGRQLENPELPSVAPVLEKENLNNMLVSTTWHLNLGQVKPLKKLVPPFDPLAVEHIPGDCETPDEDFQSRRPEQLSITKLLSACDNYPQVIEFTRK